MKYSTISHGLSIVSPTARDRGAAQRAAKPWSPMRQLIQLGTCWHTVLCEKSVENAIGFDGHECRSKGLLHLRVTLAYCYADLREWTECLARHSKFIGQLLDLFVRSGGGIIDCVRPPGFDRERRVLCGRKRHDIDPRLAGFLAILIVLARQLLLKSAKRYRDFCATHVGTALDALWVLHLHEDFVAYRQIG